MVCRMSYILLCKVKWFKKVSLAFTISAIYQATHWSVKCYGNTLLFTIYTV